MDFVSFEIAKSLKEKGFKEKCVAYYWISANEHTHSFVVEDNMPDEGICILDLLSEHNKAEWSPFVDAPTISQVLKWLREEKKYNVNMRLYNENGWYYTVQDNKGEYVHSQLVNADILYHTYEQAAIAGIEYVIDNLFEYENKTCVLELQV